MKRLQDEWRPYGGDNPANICRPSEPRTAIEPLAAFDLHMEPSKHLEPTSDCGAAARQAKLIEKQPNCMFAHWLDAMVGPLLLRVAALAESKLFVLCCSM